MPLSIEQTSEINADVVGPCPAPSPCRTVCPVGDDSIIIAFNTSSILAMYDFLEIRQGWTLWIISLPFVSDIPSNLISSVIKDAILFSLKEYLDNKEDVEQKKWASLILEKFKDIEEDKNDLKNDLDKLNRVALQIAAKYTLNTITDFQEG